MGLQPEHPYKRRRRPSRRVKDERAEAAFKGSRRDNPTPQPSATEQQPEEDREEEHAEVRITRQVARRVLKVSRSCLGRRVLLMDLARGDLRSRAKMQSPKDPVAQKKHAHKKERQKPAPRKPEGRRSTEARARHPADSTRVRETTTKEVCSPPPCENVSFNVSERAGHRGCGRRRGGAPRLPLVWGQHGSQPCPGSPGDAATGG